jgi:hypothetical protein
MKRVWVISFLGFIILSGCATIATSHRETNNSMLNFLPYLNQKIAGYISRNDLKSLDATTYKEIVKAVCSSLPFCSKGAETLFNTYTVDARMLNGMFSVLLCDKEGKIKEMEDFSCNEQVVEIRSFEINPETQCQFEGNWEKKIIPYCPGVKASHLPPENH